MQIPLLIAAIIIFAIQTFRSKRLITSALWLAGVSALLSVVFFQLGGWQVAVIELSVGAGLVTILFVFAINIAGDEAVEEQSVLPRSLVVGVVLLNALLMGWFLFPFDPHVMTGTEAPFSNILWQQRGLDILVQIVLIFAGVLGLLGLLAEAKAPLDQSIAEEVAARRESDLKTLEEASLEKEKEYAI
jgi:NADH:ubiquinone oxidoreductase subunit 6 (subunit J)